MQDMPSIKMTDDQQSAINYLAAVLRGWQADPQMMNYPDCIIISDASADKKGFGGGKMASITIFSDQATIVRGTASETTNIGLLERDAAAQGLQIAAQHFPPPKHIACIVDNHAQLGSLEPALKKGYFPNTLTDTKLTMLHPKQLQAEQLKNRVYPLCRYMDTLAATGQENATHKLTPDQNTSVSHLPKFIVGRFDSVTKSRKPGKSNSLIRTITDKLFSATQRGDAHNPEDFPPSINRTLRLAFPAHQDSKVADIFFGSSGSNYTLIAYAGQTARIVCENNLATFNHNLKQTVEWCQEMGAQSIHPHLTNDQAGAIIGLSGVTIPSGRLTNRAAITGDWQRETQADANKLSNDVKTPFTVDIPQASLPFLPDRPNYRRK